jgi:hypothetical protein
LDFRFLYANRPLWDVVALLLLVGVAASGVTSALPAYRRLAKHVRGLRARKGGVAAAPVIQRTRAGES